MNSVSRKLNISVLIITVLSLCLVFTSVVLALSVAEVPNNIFTTGIIKIELGGVIRDDQGVIEEEYVFDENNVLINPDTEKYPNQTSYLFEPGMRVEKEFYVANVAGEKGWDVYYKLFFKNIRGKLANEIMIILTDENGTELFNDVASRFIEDNANTYDKPLSAIKGNNKHYYKIMFYYPEDSNNVGQGEALEFDFCAMAVQTKNNIEKEYE